MNEKYITYEPVLKTHSPGDIAFLKSIMDAEGITYFVQGEHVAPFLFNALPMQLMVAKADVEKAQQILADISISFTYGK